MVTGAKDLLPAMSSDGLRVIFDQDLGSNSVSTKSVSRSGSDCSDSGHGSGTRETNRGRHRSSSNSSSTSSLSSSNRPRSRSHPRCHRNSSRCRCPTHYRQAHGNRRHRSPPPRRARANSRSCSPSSLPVRSSRHRSNRSRHSSSSRQRTSPGLEGRDRKRTPKSPSKSHHSRSRSSRRSAASPTLDEEKELLRAVKEDATEILRVDLPESTTPTLDEPCEECPTPEPQAWVRQEDVPEKVPSQNSDAKTNGQRSKVSPIRRIIAFSIHNSIAKPTVAPVTSAKVTPRVDGIESRKPYGHWVQIRRGGRANKRTTSR
ncbi:arginine/serine-rich protein 1 [Gadus morhua]|uniref:arginine/serine-rich protein 1 n=1 Tax=Gadus morhua TaxID=8049 RepID=UPI0011B4ECF8|nr:putative protein TPRXL [Gadus morhua]